MYIQVGNDLNPYWRSFIPSMRTVTISTTRESFRLIDDWHVHLVKRCLAAFSHHIFLPWSQKQTKLWQNTKTVQYVRTIYVLRAYCTES